MSHVSVDVDQGVMTITICRPEARNAIDRSVAEAIAAAVDELEARIDVAAAILTGAGGNFCAGMDLKAFVRGESPSLPGRGFGGLAEKPPTKPLLAAVEGWALAGGCELALSTDIIVASSTAYFGLPEVKRGLVAAGGGLLRLPKIVPYSIAMLAALTGEPITAAEAERRGLVAVLTEPGDALVTAQQIASKIAANGPLAVRATKAIIAEQSHWTDGEAFERQRRLTAPVFASADAKEGAKAFAEKRSPQWKGM